MRSADLEGRRAPVLHFEPRPLRREHLRAELRIDISRARRLDGRRSAVALDLSRHVRGGVALRRGDFGRARPQARHSRRHLHLCRRFGRRDVFRIHDAALRLPRPRGPS